MTATTKDEGTQRTVDNAAAKAKNYVRRHWKYKEPVGGSSALSCETATGCRPAAALNLFDRIQSHTLCISGMAFQDAWNIDLERLQRCCVHVATAQEKLVPFCAYYITDSRGRRLSDRE